MNRHQANVKMISDIMNNRFDLLESMKECFEQLMGMNGEVLVKIEIEMIKQKEKCRRNEEYTAEDIKKALQLYDCLMSSLNSFS
jgi:hypothetical protein